MHRLSQQLAGAIIITFKQNCSSSVLYCWQSIILNIGFPLGSSASGFIIYQIYFRNICGHMHQRFMFTLKNPKH